MNSLYKMDSKGKIREWSIRVFSDGDKHGYCQTHGVAGGKMQEVSTICRGKNIGRSNATTDLEQAELEAISLWNKKRDRSGYSIDIPSDKPLMPMLAQSYDKHGHKINYPAFVQPKLDGIRCFIHVDGDNVTLKSRTGKEFKSLGHIAAAVRELTSEWSSVGSFTLDGELYNHAFKDDFQSLVSAIKRDKPKENTHLIQFHCYDYVSEARDFNDRFQELFHLDQCSCDVVHVVETVSVGTFEDVVAQNSWFIERGYEGTMIRNAKGGYQPNRRTPDLQKYKSFKDQEFEIVNAVQNKGKMYKQCTFICKTGDGTEFGVKPRGTEAQREQYWHDFQTGILTGKMLTVKFFDWTTSENPVPRFPVGVCIRDYE